MGQAFMDKYSLLHFAVGIVFRFMGIPFVYSIFLHILFEFLENTPAGVDFIDNSPLLQWWPGGKKKADSLLNSVSDTIFFALGWWIANYLHK